MQVGFFQLWGFFSLRGVLPTVGFFFLLSAFRIWKQGRAGGVSSLGFPDLETGFMQGGDAVIRRGGVDPLNFVIDIAPSPLCHRSFWFPRLSGFGNRVRYLLYAGGVDLVNYVICNFRFSTTDYRILKQSCELDFMICRRACISRCLSNVLFVNDGSHDTLWGAKSKTMAGIDEVLEDFDMFATPIHDGPSIGSVLMPVAPRRSSGSWARPSDAEFSQGRQIAPRLLARGASSLVPQPLMEEASRARMSLVPASQCSLESVREGPTAEAFPEPQALRGSRLVLGSAPVGATDLFATVENISLAQDLALLPRYAWQTSLQSVREEARLTTGPQPLMEERQTLAQYLGSAPVGAVATAAANPYGTAEDFALAHDVTILRNLGPTGDLRPSAKEWRRSAVIRQFYWYCVRCRVTNRNDEAFCHECHDAKDAIVGTTSSAEHASLLANTQAISYGRRLQCLKDRDQRVALGSPVEIGAPGYGASIRALVMSVNVRSDATRVERAVDTHVISFDGYLALKTSGRLRFWTADDVQKLMRSGEIEAMIAEYVTEWGRTRLLPNGVLVQALPKGGWWWRTFGDVTEQHVLVVRSIIACSVLGGAMRGGDSLALRRAILEDATFDGLTYARVAAVAASLFAHMAVRERAEQGRAARAGGPCAARVADYASNGLRMPHDSRAPRILCMLAQDEPEALRYRAGPGGGSPAERLCAPEGAR